MVPTSSVRPSAIAARRGPSAFGAGSKDERILTFVDFVDDDRCRRKRRGDKIGFKDGEIIFEKAEHNTTIADSSFAKPAQ